MSVYVLRERNEHSCAYASKTNPYIEIYRTMFLDSFLCSSSGYGHGVALPHGCLCLTAAVRTEIIPSSVYSWLLGSRRIQGLGCILLFDDLFFLTWLPHCFFFSFCCVTLWFNVLCYLCMSRKSGKWLLLFGFIFVCRIAFVCCAEHTGMRMSVEI